MPAPSLEAGNKPEDWITLMVMIDYMTIITGCGTKEDSSANNNEEYTSAVFIMILVCKQRYCFDFSASG